MKKSPGIVVREPIETIADVELLPGFVVLDHTARSTVLKIPSGFTIEVSRAGPFLYELLDSDPDMKDLGPYMITVTLMAQVDPPGVEIEQVYEPPRDDEGKVYCPDEQEHPRAYAYYQGWKTHELKRQKRWAEIAYRRKDLSLIHCVKVRDGPVDEKDDDWLIPLLEFVDEPEGTQQRRLMFIKSQVITTETIRDVIMFLWRVEEVTVDGLKKAFDQFRSSIPWAASFGAL